MRLICHRRFANGPAAWRRLRFRARRAVGRLYAGHRDEDIGVQVVDRQDIAPLTARSRSTTTPSGWGRDGDRDGKLALAQTLLRHARRRWPSRTEIHAPTDGALAGLPREGFVLDADELRRWSARARRAGVDGRPQPGRSGS